VKVRGDCTFCW